MSQKLRAGPEHIQIEPVADARHWLEDDVDVRTEKAASESAARIREAAAKARAAEADRLKMLGAQA